MQSLARRKKPAETKCFPTDSAVLICPSQYEAVSSLSNWQLLHFSALRYGVPETLIGLTVKGGLIGVLTPSASLAGDFLVNDPSTFSVKETVFFLLSFVVSLLAVLGVFFADSGFGATSVFGCFEEIFLVGFGFSGSVFSGMFGFRIVPKVRLCLKRVSRFRSV